MYGLIFWFGFQFTEIITAVFIGFVFRELPVSFTICPHEFKYYLNHGRIV